MGYPLRKCFQQTTRLNGTVFDESPFILDVSRAATVCNVSNAAMNIILEGKGPRGVVGTLIRDKTWESNFPTLGMSTQFEVPHLGIKFSV